MISREEIDKTILELEAHDTTYATVERLAWLYTVRDHMTQKEAQETTGAFSGSEFKEACSGVPLASLMEILGEHMDCIRVVYPVEYASILSKIKAL